jgi:TatD DNase family protein
MMRMTHIGESNQILITAMPIFFDTHAHLDFPDFEADLPQTIERAQAAGIKKIVSIGTDLESSARAIKLAERYPCVFAAVGWHPGHVTAAPADVRPALREMAKHPKVVAIGETGLDYYRLPSTQNNGAAKDDERYKQRQAELFKQQLEVAAEAGMNCVIHQRGDCLDDTLALLTPFSERVKGVFHCFAGDTARLRRVLALGSIVSFTGIVTFKNAQTVRDTVAATPLGKFMLETDCPYLAPVPYRGKRCEPACVKEISETVAGAKGCSLDELSKATCGTAEQFFQKLKM